MKTKDIVQLIENAILEQEMQRVYFTEYSVNKQLPSLVCERSNRSDRILNLTVGKKYKIIVKEVS